MKKRYAICGVSGRAITMYVGPMLRLFADNCELVGLLDPDPKRHVVCKSQYADIDHVPEYAPDQFDRMIADTKPDVIIVTGRDDTHADYIIKALAHDLDVISEKPMATTAEDSRLILAAEAQSKGKVTVTFNYRYAPIHRKIKEMIMEGKIGKITSVDLNWYIDTYHGASYFKRWNRRRELSGGLSVHKSSHHFDLVSWWTNQRPVELFAYGALHYYGSEGEWNPDKVDGRHCATCDVKNDCLYEKRWTARSDSVRIKDDHLGTVGTGGQSYTNYRPDACIFDSEIEIEDTYAVTMKYEQGALLSYSVNFSLPYEGYRLAINGTKGRIETMEFHAPDRVPFPTPVQTIDYFPLFGAKETIHVCIGKVVTEARDPELLEDLFLGPDLNRSYPILSGALDGAYSSATGEAVWRSVKERRPIRLEQLLSI